jgi:hypothetical protein
MLIQLVRGVGHQAFLVSWLSQVSGRRQYHFWFLLITRPPHRTQLACTLHLHTSTCRANCQCQCQTRCRGARRQPRGGGSGAPPLTMQQHTRQEPSPCPHWRGTPWPGPVPFSTRRPRWTTARGSAPHHHHLHRPAHRPAPRRPTCAVHRQQVHQRRLLAALLHLDGQQRDGVRQLAGVLLAHQVHQQRALLELLGHPGHGARGEGGSGARYVCVCV